MGTACSYTSTQDSRYSSGRSTDISGGRELSAAQTNSDSQVGASISRERTGPKDYLGAAPEVRQVKVLPPIRRDNRVSKMPDISYEPHSRWGGSVPTYFETTNRDVAISDSLTFGKKARKPGRLDSITKHQWRRKSGAGDVSWEENVTVLSAKPQGDHLRGAEGAQLARFRRRSRRKSSLKFEAQGS